MTTPFGPVQAAMYDVLSGDATLDALISGAFDDVPEGTAYPYVVLGEALEIPDDSHDRSGRETTETVHIWSDKRGFSTLSTIAARVVTLLDHQPLTVAGHHHVVTRYEFGQQLNDPDPHLKHTVLRFRVITESLV